MKHNEKLLIASILTGLLSVLVGAAGLFSFYLHWPFFDNGIGESPQGEWMGRGGIMLASILVTLVFVLVSLLLLVVYRRTEVARSTIAWNGGLLLFIQLVIALCMLKYWEDVLGFVPLSSGYYFFGFAQGVILLFAKKEAALTSGP